MRRTLNHTLWFFFLLLTLLGAFTFQARAQTYPFPTGPYGEYRLGEDGCELYSGSWQQAVSLIDDDSYDPEFFSLEADVTGLSGVNMGSGCRMGFVLFSDDSAGSYVYFTIDGWNENTARGFQVNSVVNGAEKGIGTGGAVFRELTTVPGETYRLGVTVEEDSVTVYLDGDTLLSVVIPEENRYGDRFGLTACVGRANFDNVALDGIYLWTKDGKAGQPVPAVPAETEPQTEPAVQTETLAPQPSETDTEAVASPESDEPEETTAAPAAPGGSVLFIPCLIGCILIPGGASFFIFYRIGSRKKAKPEGGDAS